MRYKYAKHHKIQFIDVVAVSINSENRKPIFLTLSAAQPGRCCVYTSDVIVLSVLSRNYVKLQACYPSRFPRKWEPQ